jgi:hypothetical protein
LSDFAANLKSERDGDIDVAGAELANVLSAAGLVDEYRLYFRPYVFGTGKPYFAGSQPPLRLMKLDAIGEDAAVEALPTVGSCATPQVELASALRELPSIVQMRSSRVAETSRIELGLTVSSPRPPFRGTRCFNDLDCESLGKALIHRSMSLHPPVVKRAIERVDK